MYIITLCVCALAVNYSHAQSNQATPASLSIGANLAIPTGDLGILSSLGAGGSAKLYLPFSPHVGATVSAGYIYFFSKKIFSDDFKGLSAVPLKGGIRIITGKGLYFEPQAGYTNFTVTATQGGNSSSDGAFTYAANIGYLVNNRIDISAGFESATKQGESMSHVGLRLAYNFSLKKH